MAIAPPLQRRRRQSDEEFYPSSDGKPMGETDHHVNAMFGLLYGLRKRFDNQPDVYIAGNNFIYYQEGDPRKFISPDAYVVLGVSNEARDSYLTWREGNRLPNVVFELTSRKTKKADFTVKYALYEQTLLVPEYFLFDPTGKFLRSDPLRGFRLENGVYRPIVPQNGKLYSEQLDVDLQPAGELLRLFNPRTGEVYRTPQEDALFAEQQRRELEAQRRRAIEQAERAEQAEAELARMRAELEALRQQGSSS